MSKLRGIIATGGDNWRTQRRFGLRTLRDLGFGRRTIEEIVDREIDEITNKLGNCTGQDQLLGNDFSIPVINVLWQLVAGYRFNEDHSRGRNVINNIEKLLKNWFSLEAFPLSVTKMLRNNFFDENLKMIQNQTNYILGNRKK